MKVFNYKPDKDSGFTGIVKIKMPTYQERLKLIKDAGVAEADDEDSAASTLNLVAEHIEEVDLKCGNTEIKSLDDLGYLAEGVQLVQKIAMAFITGIPLGNL